MRTYRSPEQLIQQKIRKLRIRIGYLVISVTILILVSTLFFGLVSINPPDTPGLKPSLFAGMALLYPLVSQISLIAVFILQLLIYARIEALVTLQTPSTPFLQE
jgi:hypothetical protein